jgi:hypothetical protein
MRDLMNRLRMSRPYGVWSVIRAAAQVARYEEILSECLQSRPYSSDDLRRELVARAPSRRTVSERPNAVAFGAKHWEGAGFWQAFEAAGDFSLFDYARTLSGRTPSRSCRRELASAFLAQVDERERRGGAEVAFFYASGAFVDPELLETLRRRGIWTVVMGLDDKHQVPGAKVGDLEGWQLEVAAAADVYWTTWRAGLGWLAERGARPWYRPEGASPEFFAPKPVERDIDVLWLGRAYGPRASLVRRLRSLGLAVDAYGEGWPRGAVPFSTMVELYSRAEVVLGMGAVLQTDRIKHLKGRDFEVPMAGAAYLTSFNPELSDHFDIGREILCYTSESECAEVLAYALRRPELLAGIRRAARERCLRDHTWERRVRELYELLEAR